jgi:outer membrane lipoprotein-sorting protein
MRHNKNPGHDNGRHHGSWPNLALTILALLVFADPVVAQYKGYLPVADRETFHEKFRQESGRIQSIQSDFEQEKILTALTEKIVSTGKFWFKRSDRVRIDYQKPFVFRMIMNGGRMQVTDDQKSNTVNIRSNKLFQQVNRIMMDCIQGTILDSKDFTTRVFESEKMYLLEMTPVNKSLKEFFQTIVLTVNRRDYSVDTLEMNEAGGDQTLMRFTRKIINEPVPDEVFIF